MNGIKIKRRISNGMKVLVIGSGGREHAIAWKISQSPRAEKIFAAPGNGGMSQIAQLVDIRPGDIAGLADFAKDENIDLTIVGPEAPLVAGIVDEFEKKGLVIFGPSRKSARIEGSKVYTKELMARLGVPTAKFGVFNDPGEAIRYIEKTGAPIVVKADGLAAGKGVIVCKTSREAKEAVKKIMINKVFGSAGDRVVIEECLKGEEASIIVLSDGKNVVPLASSQDHKRIFDNDLGPNTGGMGAYSPAPVAEGELFDDTIERIVLPVIEGLAREGSPYKGVLYAGIMATGEGPFVLEFNVRFGDPETQAIFPRLKTDLLDLIERSIEGELAGIEAEWDPRACVCVVAASGGYPGKYENGKPVSGLEEVSSLEDVVVFHAGTKSEDNKILTNGGRVFGITALGADLEKAIQRAYAAAGKIHFEGIHFRKDIGRRALCRKGIL